MTKADVIFQKAIAKILTEGCLDENPRPKYKDDTPAHTLFITQHYEEYDLNKGEFPITTLRPLSLEKFIGEILWIYQDQSNDLELLESKYGVTWWKDWDIGDRTIGQRYGVIVRNYKLVDQLIEQLKTNPFGRDKILDLWQYADMRSSKGLPSCAFQTIWSVRRYQGELYLDCTLTQRSSDFLVAGVGINQMQYVAFQMAIAHEVGMKVGKFARFTQNLHIYDRHIEQAKEMLKREPSKKQPKLILNAEGKGFYDIEVSDFRLIDYEPCLPQLKFELGI